MAFTLYIDVNSSITVEPEYDYDNKRTKIEDSHRTRDASEYRYKWSAYDRISFSLMYVNSSSRALINSWWESNADLLFNDGAQVYSMHLVNDSLPVNKFIKPYNNLWRGKIELEGY